jgi:hypothetical protein
MRRPALILVVVLLAACSTEPAQQVVTVYNRCGELNFDALNGDFGRLDGGNSVNARFRVRFVKQGEQQLAKYVGGNSDRYLLEGKRTGSETMTFDEVGGPLDPLGRSRRIKAGLTSDCRVQMQQFWARGTTETKIPVGQTSETYVKYLELDRLDFEPCTEPLYLRGAAKKRDKATGGDVRPANPVAVTEDSLPIGTFGPASELASGCRPLIDIWVDGEAVAVDAALEPAEGGYVHWLYDYETDYLGVHHLALHRKSACADRTELLGVACTEIEVK